MDNLKQLTWEAHRNAERQAFTKELLGGNISNERYATYLFNQHPQYNVLENMAWMHGLFDDIPDIRRAPRIHEDYMELWGNHYETSPPVCPVVEDYLEYLYRISDDPHKLMAHIYVRHFGDLSGGQFIAKRVPGQGRMYQFEQDPEEIKKIVREKLDDSMADEARVCFNYAETLFQQLMDLKNE